MASSNARHRSRIAQRGYTPVENAYLFDPRISAGALRLYAALRHYAWKLDGQIPTQVQIARDLGTTDRSIRDDFRELEAMGLVTVERRQGTASTVWLEDAPKVQAPEDSSGEPVAVATEDSSGDHRQILPVDGHTPTREGSGEDLEDSSPNGERTLAVGTGHDAIYSALLAAVYPHGASLTPREKRKVALAARGILAAGGTPEQVQATADRYRRHEVYGKVALTAKALEEHWGELAAPVRQAGCAGCERGAGVIAEYGHAPGCPNATATAEEHERVAATIRAAFTPGAGLSEAAA